MIAAPSTRISGLSQIAENYDAILSDVWGVVHDGRTHTPSAAEALSRFRNGGGTVVLMTNAPRPKAPIVEILVSFVLPRAAYDDLVSSGDLAAQLVCERGSAPLHHIGPPRDLTLFDEVARRTGERPRRVGLDEAAYVVCTGMFDDHDAPEVYAPALEAMAARALEMICANPDIVVHVGAELLWCAGALAERYRAMGGRIVMAGKPHALIYERALGLAEKARRRPIDRKRVLAIGDGLFTDIRGALAQGFDALFVTAGVHRDRLHPGGAFDLDEKAYGDLLAETGLAPSARLRTLAW